MSRPFDDDERDDDVREDDTAELDPSRSAAFRDDADEADPAGEPFPGDHAWAAAATSAGTPAPARSAFDLTSLIGGLCLVALGTLLVLETEDVIDLSLGYIWPALLAAAGATLLASGLRKGRR